jgi:zona occludens toxin (predicted ATPase)
MWSTLLGAKVGAAMAAGVVSFGAVGAAAFTGNLPPAAQHFAHDTITSLAPDSADHGKSADAKEKAAEKKDKAADGTKTAVGPDAAGPAAFGLCTAWAHVEKKGQVAEKSVAFRNLAAAAVAADKGAKSASAATPKQISDYCLTVTKAHVAETGKSATHPTAKPSSHPTGKPSSHPTGNSSSHPTGP